MTRDKEELSGVHNGYLFDTSIENNGPELSVAYGKIETFDPSGKIAKIEEKKFDYRKMTFYRPTGEVLFVYVSRKKDSENEEINKDEKTVNPELIAATIQKNKTR